jgi:serine/threonine protein kinase
MRLQPGAKLAQFEILDVLGAGGMGEVYRARDTTLRREVALKVLPEAFADDAERLLRLQREARSLAALNHPRIAAIHGFDSVQGVHFLVLELVPGPTLAERVAAGRLPLEQAIGLCRQVAERWRRPTDGASSTAISSRPTSS